MTHGLLNHPGISGEIWSIVVYVTNVFPFVKPGGMSSGIPQRHLVHAAARFAARELEIARPSIILALGRKTYTALRRLAVPCLGLPHPAARIGAVEEHERRWGQALRDVI